MSIKRVMQLEVDSSICSGEIPFMEHIPSDVLFELYQFATLFY